jgi:hypothetical protein
MGIDTAPLIRRAGLSAKEIDDPNIRIGAANQVALLKLVGEALDDGLLGLHLAPSSIRGKSGSFTSCSPRPALLPKP